MHGNRDAFGILATRSMDKLVGTAGLILHDRDAADDAAQDALIRAWRDLPGLRDADHFDGWLYRILVHSCHDQLRRRGREHRVEPTASFEPDASQQLVDRDELSTALGRLSVEHRTAVVLHYYLGLSQPEIAVVIGQPVGTVKSRLSRAVDYLRAELAAGARVGAAREGSA
jgi:RNA polymerase sigma-70 factor (ECF subfamily)